MSRDALVLPGRLVIVPTVLGESAEVVISRGQADLVAEPLLDVQRALVLPGGLVEIPADMGNDPELVEPGGLAG